MAIILILNVITYYAASIVNRESYVANAYLVVTGAPNSSRHCRD
ncbi:MAG: hypothetical protein V1875_09070 [Candidatus Altiarchaeota archaeon]